jgi:hypothetical protein
MKTAMQELLQILESKILPCDDDNSYVYGMNVAHANLIYNIKNGFLEKEKEQIIEAFFDGATYEGDKKHIPGRAAYDYYDRYYNQKQHIIDIMKADEDDGLYKE